MSLKKELILDAAERLIAEHGYRSTTTRMIAEGAGVNVALLSYYFGSKEQVLVELLNRHTTEIKSLLELLPIEKEHPVDTFRQFLFAFVDYSFDNPNLVIIANREIGLLNQRPEILRNLQGTMFALYGMFIDTLNKAKKMGLMCNIDTELSVLTFSSTIESYIINAFMFEKEFPFPGVQSGSLEVRKEKLKNHLSTLLEQLSKDV